MKTTSESLAHRLASNELISVPGVYDLISARIADQIGFPALYMTGYGAVASALGLPDAGLASSTEMVGRVAAITARVSSPLIADADTGFGGVLNVDRTVRGYERAGAAAIQLEDQEFPKKCGHTIGRRVVDADVMVKKIKVAVAARQNDDFLIVARTDARTALGLDEALRRAELYGRAGADILFVESPETPDEMARIARSLDKPLLANLVEGGRTPILSKSDLQELGYSIAIFPALGFLAAGRALESVYGHLAEQGSTDRLTQPLHDFEDFHRLIGFQDVWDFEDAWEQS